MDRKSSGIFVGLLFKGDPKNKNWDPIVDGQVGVSLQQVGGAWCLVATKKEKVWELLIEPGFKHRVRDSFVQWQRRSGNGGMETYGLRLKSATNAQEMSEALTQLLARLEERKKETTPPLPSMSPDDVVLKVVIPGKDPANICVPKSATVQQVLRSVCQRRDLDPSQFVATLPSYMPDGQPFMCKGHMAIGELSSNEIHLSKRKRKNDSPTHTEMNGKDQMSLLQVELPRGERTVVRVPPTIAMPDLLRYICDKRNIPVGVHYFDLPATEESLASKTLQELKIQSIRVLSRVPESGSDQSAESSPSRSKKLKGKTKSHSSVEGSGQSRRRNAPPPPPPMQRRRTQPEFMRELTAEMAGRKVTRQSHDTEATPTVRSHDLEATPSGSTEHIDVVDDLKVHKKEKTQPKRRMTTGSSKGSLKPRSAPAPPPPSAQVTPPLETKARPPPVAEKPNRSKHRQQGSMDLDEPDVGPVSVLSEGVVVIKGQEVVGVKGCMKERQDRSELTDSITEAIKKQTATAERRHAGVTSRKIVHDEGSTRHMSLEKDEVHRPSATPPLTHPILVPVDIPDEDEVPSRGKTLPHRHKPRGPAPQPPPSGRSHTLGRRPAPSKAMSRSRDNIYSVSDSKEGSKVTRSPRKRPSRPAPVPPAAARVDNVEMQEQVVDFHTPSPDPPPSQESQPPTQSSQDSPPTQGSQSPQTLTSAKALHRSPASAQKAMAICQDTEDGGIVLIVQPSPSTDRRAVSHAPIVFKLPPPPPQPSGGRKGKKEENKDKKEGEKKDESEVNRSIEESAEGSEKEQNVVAKVNGDSKEQADVKVGDTKKEEMLNGDDTILSNQYTNLDDSDDSEELTMDFSNEDSEEERNQDKQNGVGTDSADTSSGEEGGYDVTVDDQSDFSKPVFNGSELPPSEDLMLNLSLNSNSNNSNDSAEELGTPPPPPPEFLDHTPNSSLDSSSASSSGLPEMLAKQPSSANESGGILLLSYKPSDKVTKTPEISEADKVQRSSLAERRESESSADASYSVSPAVEGVEQVEGVREGWTDEQPSSPGLSSQLTELDSVVTDLRNLLNAEDKSMAVKEATHTTVVEVTPTTEATPTLVTMTTSSAIPIPPPPPAIPVKPAPPVMATPHTSTLSQPSLSSVEVPTSQESQPPLPHTSTPSQPSSQPLTPSQALDTLKKSPVPAKPKPPVTVPKPKQVAKSSPTQVPPTVTMATAAETKEIAESKNLTTPVSIATNELTNEIAAVSQASVSIATIDAEKPIAQNTFTPAVTTVTETLSTNVTKSTHNELLEKFKERQEKLKAQKSLEKSESPTNSIPNTPAPAQNPIPTSGTGNDAVTAQLQFLQQQVLQQQMLQLQQQFQQLQSLAMQQPNTGMRMPGMVPGHYLPSVPNPIMYHTAQMPSMMVGQPSFQGHQSAFIPAQQPGMAFGPQPVGFNTPPGYSTPGYNTPPAPQNVMVSPIASHPPHATQQPPPPTQYHQIPPYPAPPHTPLATQLPQDSPADTPPPPPPSQPPPQLPLSTSSPVIVRKESAGRRASALGEMEDKFDALMDEVRDTDLTVVLRKIPEDVSVRDTATPTGMAAALEVALRQRRQHFSDKRRSRDIDDSFGAEWQSP